ncbi:hypothetical protein V7S43_019108 [Phytophthora oleae]|uniref:Uncharacterized protein n=1 Tax=Phytophthora oleae TaxID=2107226 RepID=A0ABD3FU48_9STRA
MLLLGNGYIYTSATKAPSTTCSLLNRVHLLDIGILNLLEDQLCHSVPTLDRKILAGVVEQDHTNIAAVISVNDASACVDKFLPREARTRRHTRVAAVRHSDDEVRLNETLATCWDHAVVGGREVQASREARTTSGDDGFGRHLLDTEHGGRAAALDRHCES